MGFIKHARLRRFEFKHFGISHTLDHSEPGYEQTLVHNPATGQDATRYVQKFDAVEGLVIDAEWYDRKDDSGTRYVGYLLTLDVDDEVITLDFPFKKPAYRILTRHGPNVAWNKRIKFSAWKSKTRQGKDTHGVCFWQVGADGKESAIKSAHTIDNPNGCPGPRETINGLDFSEAEVWLKNQFDKLCLPQIKANSARHSSHIAAMAAASSTDPDDPYGEYAPVTVSPDDSDIPF